MKVYHYILLLALLLFAETENYGQSSIQTAVDTIYIPNADSIKSHLYLPLTGKDGSTQFQWASSDTSVINPGYMPGYNNNVLTPPGVVTRKSTDNTVTLTVTAHNGDLSASKTIDVTVLATSETDEYAGYLYAYFSAVSGKSEVQQIHFAISKDGLHWKDLNENRPVLTSVFGDGGVRDPYIMRSPEGDHFYLVATDLDIYHSKYNGNWGLMATQGSTSLMIWESDDLVNWSDQRMIDVAGSIDAGNAWAPEGIFDETTNEFLVYWSSLTAPDNYAKHRIWVSKTRDFIHFTKPEIYVEEANAIIDASIFKNMGQYYMLIKNEDTRSVKLKSSAHLLDYANSTGLGNSFVKLPNSGIEQYTGGYEGPTMFKFNEEDKWCAMIDEYTGSRRGYIPFISSAIEQANSFNLAEDNTYLMPTGAKHGTIIPITQTEYDALINKWGVKATYPTSSNHPIVKYTFNDWPGNSTVKDQSGKQNDATLYGNATVIEDDEKGSVLYLDGTDNCYLQFPDGLLDGMDSLSVSMDVKPQSTEHYHFVFTLGQDNYKYAFLRIRTNATRFAITTESFYDEQDVNSTGDFYDQWMNVKIIKAGHTTRLYINDVLVDENDCMRTISDLGSQLKTYLGKSFYSGDPYFKGCFDNIIIYNKSFEPEDFPSSINLHSALKHNLKIIQEPSNIKVLLNNEHVGSLNALLYSDNGDTVMDKEFTQPGNEVNINTNQLKRGVYILRLFADGKYDHFKIMVSN